MLLTILFLKAFIEEKGSVIKTVANVTLNIINHIDHRNSIFITMLFMKKGSNKLRYVAAYDFKEHENITQKK